MQAGVSSVTEKGTSIENGASRPAPPGPAAPDAPTAVGAKDVDVDRRPEGDDPAAHRGGAGDGIACRRRVHLDHVGGRGVGVGLADVRLARRGRGLLARAGGDVHAIAVLAGKHQNDGAHHREEQSVLHISPTYGKTPARGERLSAPRLDPEAPAVRAYGYVAVAVGTDDGVAGEAVA